MPTQGPLFPANAGSAPFGAVAWSNPSRVTASDDLRTSASLGTNSTSEYLIARNFGFGIPDGVVINGIQVDIECLTTSSTLVETVRLCLTNAYTTQIDRFLGANKAANDAMPTPAEGTLTFGGAADTWSADLAASVVNNPYFAVAVRVKENNGLGSTPEVDAITMTVTYTPDTGTSRKIRRSVPVHYHYEDEEL